MTDCDGSGIIVHVVDMPSGEEQGEIISCPGCRMCSDIYIRKLERRIHNQRARLRQLETFPCHPNYWKTAYRWWVEYARKLAVENRELKQGRSK